MGTSKFDKVKRYYDTGLWNAKRVFNAVSKGWITKEQYAEITGENYEEE